LTSSGVDSKAGRGPTSVWWRQTTAEHTAQVWELYRRLDAPDFGRPTNREQLHRATHLVPVLRDTDMQPTFNPDIAGSPLHHDVVLLERWSIALNKYTRGDVVTLWYARRLPRQAAVSSGHRQLQASDTDASGRHRTPTC
jgi:hypothetical protein